MSVKKAVRYSESIEWNGLTIYPAKVYDYEEFMESVKVLLLRQSEMPPELAVIPYLRAIYILGMQRPEVRDMLSVLLSLVLRVSEEDIRVRQSEESVELLIIKDETPYTINEKQFNQLRKLITEQSGIELPKEENNADLVNSIKERDAQGNAQLDADHTELLFSVATAYGIDIDSIKNWPIFRFAKTVDAIDRRLKFEMYGQLQGMCKFENGNPYPSWCYNKKKDPMHGLVRVKDFEKRIGQKITRQKGD